ncbi:hypothetical protein ACFLTH_11400 [Bacteroidota bacterium]
MRKVFITLSIILISLINLQAQNKSAGKISGHMFGDYYYNVARDADHAGLDDVVLKGKQDFSGFAFRRIYFTYDYKISNVFSTRFRVEADQSGNVSNGKFGLAVKDAYLKWKNIFDGSDLIIGLQPPPAFVVSEKYWGYRSLEKTIMDLRGIVSSRDLGVSLKGKLTSGGDVNYWITVANGEGNKPEVNKYKRYYAHIDFKPAQKLRVTVYGDLKTQAEIEDPNNRDEMVSNNIITAAVFAGYQEKGIFSIGAEGFYRSETNGLNINNELENSNAIGFSLFGTYEINNKFSVIGRFDHFDPLSHTDYEGDSRNLIIAGVSYRPDPKVAIMPNVMIESYEKLPNGDRFDPSVTARITVYYEFL